MSFLQKVNRDNNFDSNVSTSMINIPLAKIKNKKKNKSRRNSIYNSINQIIETASKTIDHDEEEKKIANDFDQIEIEVPKVVICQSNEKIANQDR